MWRLAILVALVPLACKFDGELDGIYIADAAPVTGWWNDEYPARRAVTVVNESDAEMPAGYAVGVDFDQAMVSADPNLFDYAIRVSWWDGTTWIELDRVLDNDDAVMERVWFNLQAPLPAGASTDAYYLYYGDLSPTAPPADSDAVFPLFHEPYDDTTRFDTAWTVSGSAASATVAGGELTLDPGTITRTNATFGPGVAVDVSFVVPLPDDGIWGGFQSDADLAEPWLTWVGRADGMPELRPEVLITAVGADPPLTGAGRTYTPDAPEIFTVVRYDDHVVFRHHFGDADDLVLPAAHTTPLTITIANDGTGTARVTYVRARTVVDPEPTVTLGAEEPHP